MADISVPKGPATPEFPINIALDGDLNPVDLARRLALGGLELTQREGKAVLILSGARGLNWFLDDALGKQAQELFAAEAIVRVVSDSIERRYSEDMDSCKVGTPNYSHALEAAVDHIRRAYGNLELAALQPIAEQLRRARREAEEEAP